MASLYYPQLSSGALAQYPIKKIQLFRTIKNVLPDGSMFLSVDSGYSHRLWNLSYIDLSISDIRALQGHFAACSGRLRAFTFIDPTDNMLLWSSDLSQPVWQNPSASITVHGGAADPFGGLSAFTITNNGESTEVLMQTLSVPSNFNYCFSIYLASLQDASATLIRSGSSTTQAVSGRVSQSWTRLVSAGRLDNSGTEFAVGLSLSPGQQLTAFGPQLEAQPASSPYRSTAQSSGVYPDSHWSVEQLPIAATAPGLFSTTFAIETIA
jgi:hypothetical protein